MNYKITSLILNGSNIDAHLEDSEGYCVVHGVELGEFIDFILTYLNVTRDAVLKQINADASYFKGDMKKLLSENYYWLIQSEFATARTIDAQQEQQLRLQEQSSNTEQNF